MVGIKLFQPRIGFDTRKWRFEGDSFLGRVSDEELVKLYSNALAFIFPSFYEGFGIPPLEAQACGCPVASSNRASLPEVLSDSVLYFSPDNEVEIITTMELLIASQSIRNDLIERGYKNVKDSLGIIQQQS